MTMANTSGCNPDLLPKSPPPPGLASPWLGNTPRPSGSETSRTTTALRGNVPPSQKSHPEMDHESSHGITSHTRVMSPSGLQSPEDSRAAPQTSCAAVAPGGPHKAAKGLEPCLDRHVAPGHLRRQRLRPAVPGYRPARLLGATEPPPGLRGPSEDLQQVGGGGSFGSSAAAVAELPCGARARADRMDHSFESQRPSISNECTQPIAKSGGLSVVGGGSAAVALAKSAMNTRPPGLESDSIPFFRFRRHRTKR